MANFKKIFNFSQTVIEGIGFYVYGLVDPRDKELFYIGKGFGNRVFQHEVEDKEKEKNLRILDIQQAGLNVEKLILRHDLTENEAFAVEATLIGLLSSEAWMSRKLTNIQSGHHSFVKGLKTVNEVEAFYAVEEIQKKDFLHNAMIININRSYKSALNGDVFEATRGNWVVSGKRLSEVEIVIAEYRGVFRAIFKPEKWYESDHISKSGKPRMRFDGRNVSDIEEYKIYMNKRNGFKQKGMANPIQYVFIE